ncbi:acyl-ACP--UDP-N-acetylglucosamine O-acyltransferase [Prosthecobacter sp.]|uniref:acyl-ACP--UDP-N-acetylglucosamine O-acyltransferase n=1 Tax=Prosthecobacter sp. TaxID=1965333 RepID=UPI002ABC162A|nr:acyl-ACP--UDP-N-acetylglucosamine O-acyltransferase [Prosthecobacter sp.]MDZ4403087.1 acyl-ACP--UDP-N-acetylglucosamine O-acyltransferase [Prosthecobacter sp.]
MIHPTALIDPRAQIDPTAAIGPYVVIDGAAEVGAGCKVEAHAQLVGHVVVGEGTWIGRGAVIGGEPQDLGFDPATESSVVLGKKNVIREHVTIHRGSKSGGVTRIGDENYLMATCHLAHDVALGDRNILANGVLLAGHIHVGSHTFLGGGAVFHQFLRIGDYCVVQGNGAFSKDIPHYCCGARLLNRITGLNVIGLRRQGFSAEDRGAIKELFQLLFCGGMNLSQAVERASAREWPEKARRLLEFVQAPSKKGICPVRRGRGDD